MQNDILNLGPGGTLIFIGLGILVLAFLLGAKDDLD